MVSNVGVPAAAAAAAAAVRRRRYLMTILRLRHVILSAAGCGRSGGGEPNDVPHSGGRRRGDRARNPLSKGDPESRDARGTETQTREDDHAIFISQWYSMTVHLSRQYCMATHLSTHYTLADELAHLHATT